MEGNQQEFSVADIEKKKLLNDNFLVELQKCEAEGAADHVAACDTESCEETFPILQRNHIRSTSP